MKALAAFGLFLLILSTSAPVQAQYSGYCPNCTLVPGTDMGSADAYVVTFTGCSSTLTAGSSTVTFKANNANALVNPTLNFCSSGLKTIVKGATQSPLVAGDINIKAYMTYIWDGTYWVLQNPASSPLSLTCSIPSNALTSTYFCLNSSGTGAESLAELPLDFAFVINSMSCWAGVASNWTMTLHKNGASCGISFTSNTGSNLWQATGTCAGLRGDTIDLALTTASGTATPWSCNLSGYRF